MGINGAFENEIYYEFNLYLKFHFLAQTNLRKTSD